MGCAIRASVRLITGAAALTIYFALRGLDHFYQHADAGSLFDHLF